MTPVEARRIADLERQLAALARQVGNARGVGVSQFGGATQYRTTQLGFEAELTTGYDPFRGYGWKRKALVPGASPPFIDPGIQLTGDQAFSFASDEGLVAGTTGWLEPDPGAVGWVFIHRDTGASGSGAAGACGCCDLETVTLDVVTDVNLAACTVTKKRVRITGCNLSLVMSNPPSGAGDYCLEGTPDLSITIPDGIHEGVYGSAYVTNGGTGEQAGWFAAESGFVYFADGKWWASSIDGETVTEATEVSCEPFGLTFPGTVWGSSGPVTVALA